MHILPLGCFGLIFEAQAKRGENFVIKNKLVKGTMLDPRTGRGSALSKNAKKSYITVDEEENFKMELPYVDVAMFAAPAADSEGNIYFKLGTMYGESIQIA